ncbi:MAG: hypothetical protein KZQ99_21795 [Candidatus Thiodiazotropha sp. (ex Dulcina madagascariensis)]|nr:hypothetical protein [Candidatus Thiodiazotropha sp. (ex Dulcina madagascariensis)]
MPLIRDNNLRLTGWMLVVILLLSWGEGLLAGFTQDQMPMGEDSPMHTGGDQHCQLPEVEILHQDCGCGCASLQQTLMRRDFALLGFERIDQPTWLFMDPASPLPVRGPPRDEMPVFSSTPPIPIPPRLSFCCLRI